MAENHGEEFNRHFDTSAGTEELAHLEMVGTMVKQLTENASVEEIERAGLAPYYADHDRAVFPQSAGGAPFTAAYIQSKGDPITDLYEDMAADAAMSQEQHIDLFL